MDTPKKNKFAMAQTVNAVLTKTDYKSIWQTMPGFVKYQASLATEIAFITQNAPKTIRRKTGSAEDKEAARRAVCKEALVIAGAVAAYAHDIGNHELLVRVDTNLTLLMGGRGQDSHDKCKDILDAATANLSVLGNNNVTQADLDNLKELLADYAELLPQPKLVIGSAKGAGQAIEAALDRIDGILNNGLDNLILKFEEAHPEFFRDYTNARLIIDHPGGRGNKDETTPTTPVSPTTPAK